MIEIVGIHRYLHKKKEQDQEERKKRARITDPKEIKVVCLLGIPILGVEDLSQ